MALKGNLSTVSLADIFQVLSHGHSTGLLRIQAPEGTRFVEILDGQVSIVARTSNRILLGDLLLSRGLIDEAALNKALASQKQSGKLLGQVLMEMNALQMVDIENALRFQIEEEICDLFLLKSAEFDFLANATLDAKMALGGGLVRLKIDPNGLLLEAARRLDDWSSLEKRISSQSMLFEPTEAGLNLLKSGEGLSAEGMILLQLASEGRTIESMVQKACLGRLNTNLLLTELWDAGLLQPGGADSYVKVAQEHLEQGRIEEAERVAQQALKTESDKSRKDALTKVLAEVEKKKKTGTSAGLDTTARTRSEVIRRPNPALILRKQRSPLPLILAGVAVLGLAAGGLWFFVFRPKPQTVNTEEQKAFDAWVQQIDAAANRGDYAAAVELLKHNYSTQALREKANEQSQKFKKFIESQITSTFSEADQALASNQEAGIKKYFEELTAIQKLQVLDGALAQQLQDTLDKLRRWNERLELAKCEERLRKIEGLENSGEQLAELTKMLEENHVEAVASRIREDLAKLAMHREVAEDAFANGSKLDEVGELTAAKIEFEAVRRYFPGSDLAKQAEGRLQKLAERSRAVEQDLSQLERKALQKQMEEARDGLIRFLDSRPEPLFADRARSVLRTLVPPDGETGAEKGLREADGFAARNQDAQARQKRIETLEKFPHTMAIAKATLKVALDSMPKGCKIYVNGREIRETTPAVVDLPAVGAVRLRLKKKGFEDAQFIDYNFRGEKISMQLARTRAMPLRLLPAAPSAGMALNGAWLAMAGGSTAMAMDLERKDGPELLRANLGDGAGTLVFAPTLAARKNAPPVLYAASSEKAVYAVPLDGMNAVKMAVNSAPCSSPYAYADPEFPTKYFVGIAVDEGFEHLNADGTRRFAVRQFGSAEVSKTLGMAFDGQRFFVPRPDGKMYAVQTKDNQGWEVSMPPSPVAPPACNPGTHTVAVVGATGKASVFEAGSDKKVFDLDLGGTCGVGLAPAGKGYVALTEDGRVHYFTAETAKVAWTAEVGKGVTLVPAEAGSQHVVVAAPAEVIVINAESGEIAWRNKFASPPVAVAADAKRVCIATKDAFLHVYNLTESEK
ncbi:MAG: DUF4388 domain-containing protein [Planctomycetota bacterium]|nr:DUF4388 domain-containing protein [Planctomycetota bacterium]